MCNKRNADGKICIFILFVEYELESRKEIEKLDFFAEIF